MANLNPRNRHRDDPNQGRLFGDAPAGGAQSGSAPSSGAEPVRPAAQSLLERLGIKGEEIAALDHQRLSFDHRLMQTAINTLSKLCVALHQDPRPIAFDDQSRALGYKLRLVCMEYGVFKSERLKSSSQEVTPAEQAQSRTQFYEAWRAAGGTNAASAAQYQLLMNMAEKLAGHSDELHVVALAFCASLTLSGRCAALKNESNTCFVVGGDRPSAFGLDIGNQSDILGFLVAESSKVRDPKR